MEEKETVLRWVFDHPSVQLRPSCIKPSGDSRPRGSSGLEPDPRSRFVCLASQEKGNDLWNNVCLKWVETANGHKHQVEGEQTQDQPSMVVPPHLHVWRNDLAVLLHGPFVLLLIVVVKKISL